MRCFSKIHIEYPDHIKLCTLDISCPEAARLCLTDPKSMKILENKKEVQNNFIKLLPEKYKNSKIGEKVLNFCFSLTINEKLKLNEISLIINLIIQQRENLYNNENLVDSFLTDLKKLYWKRYNKF